MFKVRDEARGPTSWSVPPASVNFGLWYKSQGHHWVRMENFFEFSKPRFLHSEKEDGGPQLSYADTWARGSWRVQRCVRARGGHVPVAGRTGGRGA